MVAARCRAVSGSSWTEQMYHRAVGSFVLRWARSERLQGGQGHVVEVRPDAGQGVQGHAVAVLGGRRQDDPVDPGTVDLDPPPHFLARVEVQRRRLGLVETPVELIAARAVQGATHQPHVFGEPGRGMVFLDAVAAADPLGPGAQAKGKPAAQGVGHLGHGRGRVQRQPGEGVGDPGADLDPGGGQADSHGAEQSVGAEAFRGPQPVEPGLVGRHGQLTLHRDGTAAGEHHAELHCHPSVRGATPALRPSASYR